MKPISIVQDLCKLFSSEVFGNSQDNLEDFDVLKWRDLYFQYEDHLLNVLFQDLSQRNARITNPKNPDLDLI